VGSVETSWWLLAASYGVVGSCVGSFLNVVAARVPEGRSVVSPPSACPHCRHPIRARDNVPVLSWLLLRARCRDCGEGITARYPAVEALAGALWLGVFLVTMPAAGSVQGPEPLILSVIYSLYFSALLAISLVDADHFIIPDTISLPLIPLGIAVAGVLDMNGLGSVTFPESVLGALVGGGVMLAIAEGGRLAFGREAMGTGDVKLMAAVGAWQGMHPDLLITIFGGSLIGSVVGIGTTVLGGGKPARLPFGPYLCAGALIAWAWGDAIMARVFPAL